MALCRRGGIASSGRWAAPRSIGALDDLERHRDDLAILLNLAGKNLIVAALPVDGYDEVSEGTAKAACEAPVDGGRLRLAIRVGVVAADDVLAVGMGGLPDLNVADRVQLETVAPLRAQQVTHGRGRADLVALPDEEAAALGRVLGGGVSCNLPESLRVDSQVVNS